MDRSSDVIVVGAGVVGLAVALRLRQAGAKVMLLERGVCGREASWAGAGIVAPANPHRKDSIYRMHCASLDAYPGFCAEVAELSGVDPEFVRCGGLDLLTTEQAVQMAGADARVTEGQTTDDGEPILETLTADEALELEPNVSSDWLGFAHCRRTAQVRNPRFLAATRLACERVGVEIFEGKKVRSVVVKKGRVTGAHCGDDAYSASHVVLCSGAWTSEIGDRRIGELMPIYPVRGQMVLVQTREKPIRRIITKRKNYLVCRQDGHLLIGATEERDSGFDKRTTAKGVNGLIESALAMVPVLAEASVAAMWAGLRPATPDLRPYLGPVPGFSGLIAAAGHFRSGLTLAPVTAEIVRDLVVSGRTKFDLRRCAPGRDSSNP
jgi:glycine oxidase